MAIDIINLSTRVQSAPVTLTGVGDHPDKTLDTLLNKHEIRIGLFKVMQRSTMRLISVDILHRITIRSVPITKQIHIGPRILIEVTAVTVTSEPREWHRRTGLGNEFLDRVQWVITSDNVYRLHHHTAGRKETDPFLDQIEVFQRRARKMGILQSWKAMAEGDISIHKVTHTQTTVALPVAIISIVHLRTIRIPTLGPTTTLKLHRHDPESRLVRRASVIINLLESWLANR